MKLRLGRRAQQQIRKIERWWVEHRTAPELFTEELEQTFRHIRSVRTAGIGWPTARHPTLRRMLMPRTGKTLAIQAARRMKQLGLTTTALAARMHTSRNQVHRILDERDAGITLRMLFRLASALDLSLRLALGSRPPGRARGRSKRRQSAPEGRRASRAAA